MKTIQTIEKANRPRLFTALLAAATLAAAPAFAAQEGGGAADQARGLAEQAVFCDGTYALCIKAPCSPIPTLERQVNYAVDRALCSCDVVTGWSMGPGACEDRRPIEQGGRTYLISTYSNLYNDEEMTLHCNSADTVWAWCYGAPCVIDEKDPAKAVCTCPIDTGPARTLGGNCRQGACDLIWSAATPAGDLFANRHYYQWMQENHPNVPVNGPAPRCPAEPSTGSTGTAAPNEASR